MKSKLYLSVILIGLFFSVCEKGMAQAPAWEWANSVGNTSNDQISSMAVDGNGNSFVTGTFNSDSITFGSTTLVNTDTSKKTTDIFIVQYDSSGNVVWAKSAGGVGNDTPEKIAIDNGGYLYLIGEFDSTSITLGGTTLTNANVTSKSSDIFIAKLDPSGNPLWAKSAGGAGDDYGTGISHDGIGNCYITGYFTSDTIAFDSINLLDSIPGVGYPNFFVTKYDGSGNAQWAKKAGGVSNLAVSIVSDATGNTYLTGTYYQSIKFGATTLYPYSLYGDAFIVKYNTSGNVVWAKDSGFSQEGTDAVDVILDANENLYVTGTYTLINPSSNYQTNFFIVKYDSSGNVLWGKREGTYYDDDKSYDMAIDTGGNLYLVGGYSYPGITLGTSTLDWGISNHFVVSYDSSGTVLWSKRFGDGSVYNSAKIGVDANGKIYLSGMFTTASIFFGSTTLFNAGGKDIYIAKLNSFVPGTTCSAYFTISYDLLTWSNIILNQATGTGPLTYSWDWNDGTTSPGATPSHNYIPTGNDFHDICLTIVDSVGCSAYYCDYYHNLGTNNTGTTIIVNTVTQINCSAYFTVYPDTLIPHHWFVLNQATGKPPLTYTWNWGDGTTSTGATPSHTYTTAGWQYICLTIVDSDSCANMFCNSFNLYKGTDSSPVDITVIMPQTNGIENLNGNSEVTLYPNPATDHLTLALTDNFKKVNVIIRDITGKIVYNIADVRKQKLAVDIKDFSAGIYFVQIQNPDFIETKKLIIQK